ncbi:MAG: hypothetical protein V4608_07560 [Bacteroidota bacterium]
MNKISTKQIINSINTEMKKEVKNNDEFPFEPGNNIINNLLNYSKSLSISKSKNMDYFEFVLN